MQTRKLWAAWVGVALLGLAGCQTTSGRGSAFSSMGFDSVPRQSEPPLEHGRSTASAEPVDIDESPTSGKSDSLFSRLIPGRDKQPPAGRALPVTERTASATDDDGFDL